MTTHKTFSRTMPNAFLKCLFAMMLTACTSNYSPLQTANSTKTVEPTLWSIASTTQSTKTTVNPPTKFVKETPLHTRTSIPSPSPTPAYSYLPTISEANVTEVVKLDHFDGGVNSIAISPNGKYLAATFNNGTGIIWDISGVKYWREWHDAPKYIFVAKGLVNFNSDSSVLATGGTLIGLPSMKIIQELPGTVTFSPFGEKVVLAAWDVMSLWSYTGNQWSLDYKQDTQGMASLAISPDGSLLGEALWWGYGEGVNIWSVSDHTLLYSFPPPEHNHPAHFNTEAHAFLAFSPDNRFVATGTKDEPVVRIWNLQSGEHVKDINTVVKTTEGFYIPDIECLSFSQDAKVIAIAGYDTIIFKKYPMVNILEC